MRHTIACYVGIRRKAVLHAAGEQLGESFCIGGGVERRLLEQAVVLEEVAGDGTLKSWVPRDEAVADDLAPRTFEVWIKVAMAYAVDAQDGKRFCQVNPP